VMFVVELLAGLASGSASLVSDSLDMLGDALVYAFSLYAVAQSARIKAQSALLKGVVMAAFALLAFGQVIYKLAVPQVPAFEVIGGIGLLALAANGVCFAMLWRHRSDDINMSSVWLCSRNDLIANAGVIAAAAAVWLTATRWPDLIVGLAIAVLFAKSAVTVLTGALRELRQLSP
ncbi:MAG: cation transporter, partial [Rhodanobacter sp.]